MSRERASQLRQELRRAEESRRRHVETLVGAQEMVVGSFVTLGRRCGKESCRCASGELHYSKFLSRSEGGRTRLVYVRSAHEVEVARKAERYRGFRAARAELMKLAAHTSELADELQALLSEPYPPSESAKGRRQVKRAKGGRGR
jgi:hypothetical protein